MSGSEHPWFRQHPVDRGNIVWHWEHATRGEIEHGMSWYAKAHAVAVAIADGDARLGAGILAVYSPQQGWIANVHLAARVLRTGTGIGGLGCGAFASTTQQRAADRILAGEPYQRVLSGPKVRAFAHLIEHGADHDPACPHVVIDRHALSVAHGQPLTVAQYSTAPVRGVRRRDGTVSHPHYDHVAALYHDAATEITRIDDRTVTAHQIQAVTWLVRQRLNTAAISQRGMSLLDKGRETVRRNAENAWRDFRTTHLPHVRDWPGTGYLSVACPVPLATSRAHATRRPRSPSSARHKRHNSTTNGR